MDRYILGSAGRVANQDSDGNLQFSFAGSSVADGANSYIPGMLYNGSTYDRPRGNVEGTLLASAARTALAASATQTNHNARGVLLTLNVTGNPGGGETLTLLLQHIDPVSGATVTLANSGVVITAANGVRTFMIYPGAVETLSNTEFFVQGIAVPRSWRAVVVPSASGSWTYSLGYSLID